MILILPVAGQSSRYPNMRPKWMLNHPNGNLMLAQSFFQWDLENVESIVVICLRQHEEQYNVQNMLSKQFAKLGLLDKLHVVIIEQSNSQPHSVYQGLMKTGISGPIFIKDSDNYFYCSPKGINEVCFANISDYNGQNVGNKSYIVMNEVGSIVNIVEKRIISDTFCTGGYGFADAGDFINTFEKLIDIPDLYISHIIYKMMLDGFVFSGSGVSNYLDWGTLDDWNAYRQKFCTLFIDLDGVLVENSAEYFHPIWGETDIIQQNVDIINQLYNSGYSEIILTTSRTQIAEAITRDQLARTGVKYHRIIFGIMHAKRIIVNDYSDSNPYRSCDAVNIKRNSNQLKEMLQGLMSLPAKVDEIKLK